MEKRSKCSSWSRQRFFILVVLLTVMLVLSNTYLVEQTVGWPSAAWFPYDCRGLLKVISDNSTGSLSEISTVERGILTDAFTATEAASGSEEKTTATVLVAYVSPGPYYVEYPHEYHFIVDEPKKCEENKPFVVLMVPVAPYDRAARDTVRSTWGSESLIWDRYVVSLFFLLALPSGEGSETLQEQLLQESREHRDLLQSDFKDSYKNLTIKTMVMLEWLNSRCPNASYAMKIDSDMFLNVKGLVNLLLTAPKHNYMTGLIGRGGPVLRDPNNKWHIPSAVFAESVYPPYALGLGYVISLDLPAKLVGASRHIKAVSIEDVYLGLCMRYLGIPPSEPPMGAEFHVHPSPYDRCRYSRIIATTTYSMNDQINAWKDSQKPGPTC